jgi:glucose/arabinose dehydrogenase
VGVEDIFVAEAWETGGNLAGRMLFGPDGTLYVTVGDRDRVCCNGTDDISCGSRRGDWATRRQDLAAARRRIDSTRQSLRRAAGRALRSGGAAPEGTILRIEPN